MAHFANKVAIVTGSSSGIGAATAKLLASQGASVTLHGRNAVNLRGVFDECMKAGATAKSLHMVLGDVTDEKVQTNLVKETVERFGKLDILVNNAGVVPQNCDTVNGSMEVFDYTMNINLRSVVQLSKMCIPHLKESKGAIVNVSSVAGLRPNPTFSYYCIAKIGVDHFTKCLALELAPSGVRVNSVNPATVRTALWTRENPFTKEQQDMMMEGQAAAHPIGRIGEAEDVANAIAFLSNPQNTWLTGVNLPLDGAYSLTGAGPLIMKQTMGKIMAAAAANKQ